MERRWTSDLYIPPPVPYAYLSHIHSVIAGAGSLPEADQKAVPGQLRNAQRHEDDEGVLADVTTMLRDLRGRPDITRRVAGEIDILLGGGSPPPRTGGGWTTRTTSW